MGAFLKFDEMQLVVSGGLVDFAVFACRSIVELQFGSPSLSDNP